MYARVVRFTDVTQERIDALLSRVEASGGPPEGVRTTGLKILFDADQGSAIALQLFATEQDMADAEKVFDAMDSSDTPGTRVSVDRCEVKVELDA